MVDFVLYLIMRGFILFVRALPTGVAYGFGRLLGTLIAVSGLGRKALVRSNMTRVFGGEGGNDKTPEEIDALVRSFYKNFGMNIIDFARLGKASKEYRKETVEFEGLDNLKRAKAKGRGVVLLSAHFGSWETLNAALAVEGYAMGVIARPIDNSYIDRYIERMRSRFGNDIIEKKNSVRNMLTILKGGGILGILLDQRASRKESVEVDFFGTPARTNKGLASILAKTGSIVVPIYIHRVANERHRVVCMAEVEMQASSDRDADIAENTRRFNSAIEGFIRAHPEEWFWFHSRWERRKKRG